MLTPEETIEDRTRENESLANQLSSVYIKSLSLCCGLFVFTLLIVTTIDGCTEIIVKFLFWCSTQYLTTLTYLNTQREIPNLCTSMYHSLDLKLAAPKLRLSPHCKIESVRGSVNSFVLEIIQQYSLCLLPTIYCFTTICLRLSEYRQIIPKQSHFPREVT